MCKIDNDDDDGDDELIGNLTQVGLDTDIAPRKLWGWKNWPDPFPVWMSQKATALGFVCSLSDPRFPLSVFYAVY